jgi:uncharacterized protein (TIGR00369 family)
MRLLTVLLHPKAVRSIFEKWAAGGEHPPIAQLVGFRLHSYAPDHVILEMEAGPRHANPMGTLHGGILCDIADAAMGTAFGSGLQEGESMTTIELKINFFRPFWNGLLRAEAHVLRRGKSVGYVECEIKDDRGRLVAKAGSTLMTLRGDKAAGR